MDWITSGLAPLYTLGVKIWNTILQISLLAGLTTPDRFSHSAWSFVSESMIPFFTAIAATMLNLFFYIGICRQVGNLRESMTLENGLNIMIKVLLGNLGINSVLLFSNWVFGTAGLTSNQILAIDDFRGMEQDSLSAQETVFYMIFGIIFLVIALVSAATVFITIYMRNVQLYMLAAVGPIAVSCIPGGPGIQNAAGAWIKSLLGKSFSMVIISMSVVLISKINSFMSFTDIVFAEISLPSQCLGNMFMMMLTAASVKAADMFLKQTFGI